jgi:hypothetical protein
MKSYFRYYRDQCVTAMSDNHENVKTHHDIVHIALQLTEQESNATGTGLLGKDEMERYWMNFAVRVLTVIDVGGLRQGLRLGQTPRTWTRGSLREFVSSGFPKPVLADGVKLQ